MTDESDFEDISRLQASAIEVHEVFIAYQAAGFTQYQALELVKSMILGAQMSKGFASDEE